VEHLQHFGLTQDPFSNEPDLRVYFDSVSHREAQRRVERGLRQHKGLTLLTADSGMGKTLLARRILDALEEEVFEATLLVMHPGAADATGILQRLARQIGCDEPSPGRAELLGQIYEHLAIVREDGRHAILMVDDAQIMSPEAFSELTGLLNLEYEDRRLLSMLLIGTSELDALVEGDARILPRVDVRVRLHALDPANTQAYLSHRLAMVGGQPELIPAATMETLAKFGRGRPRLLNTLADNALFEAYLAGRDSIEPGDIERAAADLGIGIDPGTTLGRPAPSPLPAFIAAPTPEPAPAPEPAAAEPALVVDTPVPSLELDEPMADLDLTPEMEAPRAPVSTPNKKLILEASADTDPALDLDVDFGGALEDFADAARAAGNAESNAAEVELSLAVDPFELDFAASEEDAVALQGPALEGEPLGALAFDEALESEPAPLEAVELAEAAEFELAEAELSPLGAEEAAELDDAFVELLEE